MVYIHTFIIDKGYNKHTDVRKIRFLDEKGELELLVKFSLDFQQGRLYHG